MGRKLLRCRRAGPPSILAFMSTVSPTTLRRDDATATGLVPEAHLPPRHPMPKPPPPPPDDAPPTGPVPAAHPPPRHHMVEPPRHLHGWFAPLRSRDLPRGRPVPFSFMGHELVAFRDAAGAPVVLDAICPHFGAHL